MTPEEIRAWAEQHRQRTIEKLEARRRGSLLGFVLMRGVLLLGLPCGFLVTASQFLGLRKFREDLLLLTSGLWIGFGVFAGFVFWFSLRTTIERLKKTPLGLRDHPRHREIRMLQLYGLVACFVPNYLCSREHQDTLPFFFMLAISGAVVGIWGALRLAPVLEEAKAAGLVVNVPKQKRIAFICAGVYALMAFVPILTGGWGLFVWLSRPK